MTNCILPCNSEYLHISQTQVLQWVLSHFKTIFLYSVRLEIAEVSYCVEAGQLDVVVRPLLHCRLSSSMAACHVGIAKVGTQG